jgi:hypothetical protein
MRTEGYELYGKVISGKFVFALKASVEIGSNTTFWLNTDQNVSTGYKVFGFAGGAEFNVYFSSVEGNITPGLYTGGAGETAVGGTLAHAFSGDRKIVEFEVPLADVDEVFGAADVLAHVNSSKNCL